jgi:ssDNA-binding Zn-finger/Zn-ribbon topoisomerase 1
MILKQKQFKPQTDPRLVAGDAAEKQMAFYLQRMFAQAQDIFVINDLRIEHAGEVAQVDHLIISRWGLCIVESKSVTDSVHINAHGEWAREYHGKKQGMPSPVRQGEAQGRILKQLLTDNKPLLLGTLLGMLQKGFFYCPARVYVAISDSGMIQRDMVLPEVMKADAVAPAIESWLKEQPARNLKEFFSLSLKVETWSMSDDEAKCVADFLLARHSPLGSAALTATPPAQCSVIAEGQPCPECGTHKLLRKSLTRADSPPREFLACAGYPKTCRGIFPLPNTMETAAGTAAKAVMTTTPAVTQAGVYQAGDPCPQCGDGKLVKRTGTSEFLGCSNFRTKRCTFTDYREAKLQA